jgi:hypothetical protein
VVGGGHGGGEVGGSQGSHDSRVNPYQNVDLFQYLPFLYACGKLRRARIKTRRAFSYEAAGARNSCQATEL